MMHVDAQCCAIHSEDRRQVENSRMSCRRRKLNNFSGRYTGTVRVVKRARRRSDEKSKGQIPKLEERHAAALAIGDGMRTKPGKSESQPEWRHAVQVRGWVG